MNTLNTREEAILKSTVQSFIRTAAPVGSGRVAQESSLGLRSASVRRIMSALEEKGYLVQPHTSGGRIPTTTGYRYYVNKLVELAPLVQPVKNTINRAVEKFSRRSENFSHNLSDILAGISMHMSVVFNSRPKEILFERIQIVPSNNHKAMVLLFGKHDFIQSLLLDVSAHLNREKLQKFLRRINFKLKNLPLDQAHRELDSIISGFYADAQNERQFLTEVSRKLFARNRENGYSLTGTRNILKQPEFSDLGRVSLLIDLLEDRSKLTRFLENRERPPGIRVTIGREHQESRIQACTVITSTFQVGQISGLIGVIGPTRISYAQMIPLVDYTARAISGNFGIC